MIFGVIMTNEQREALITAEQDQLKKLRIVQKMSIQMALATSLESLLEIVATGITKIVPCKRIMTLIVDDQNRLVPSHINALLNNNTLPFPKEFCVATQEDDPLLKQWRAGKSLLLGASGPTTDSVINPVLEAAAFKNTYSLPMLAQDQLVGVLLLELEPKQSFSDSDKDMLSTLAAQSAACFYNQNRHEQTVKQLADKMREITMLAQLDREVNETIRLQKVFTMILDWALRFTNAHCASIALYDSETDVLRTLINYGYLIKSTELERLRDKAKMTITRQVARSGEPAITNDISTKNPTHWVMEGIQSQLAAPLMRESRVIAVMTLESQKKQIFTEERVAFAIQLANRAATAVENARLYDETVHEREKLSHIVENIGDAVIVIDATGRVAVMSQSARSALQLYVDSDCIKKQFETTVTYPLLVSLYRQAINNQEIQDSEITFPNGRNYYVRAIPNLNVGCVITMQDITPYKETDRLKNELIATVSHDLKQPLGIMKGYLELLGMKNDFGTESLNYVDKLENAIARMQQLIDDLLDLARLESGVKLKLSPIPLKSMLMWCVESNRAVAIQKNITIDDDLPNERPFVQGDKTRLEQIFNNLIGNAIKYTPPEGHIKVKLEDRGATMRIIVQDNGLGIGPEDQPHIFDRFYRVRRPETESIEGTGLGLAIVKALVEAHQGRIRLESRLDEGSSFHVTLPAFRL
jgi:signal transduction histidine kinase/GAF domain-containing protein